MHRRFQIFLAIVAALVAVDQVVKHWARTVAEGVEGRVFNALWPEIFELKLVYNEGIAFGMMQGAGVVLAPIAVAIAVGAGWYIYKNKDEPICTTITMGLLAAGAIGNLIDRVLDGRVTDMFWIRAINFPVFNVADVCITAAGTMLVLTSLKEMIAAGKNKEPDGDSEPQSTSDS